MKNGGVVGVWRVRWIVAALSMLAGAPACADNPVCALAPLAAEEERALSGRNRTATNFLKQLQAPAENRRR
jgi:hypothetical protein